MDKIRTLVIRYENRLAQREIPLFRGAVINTMGDSADRLYHNHNGDSVVYNYPLIQYKRIGQCAAIVAVDAGVDVMGQFLSSDISRLHIGEREENFKIADVRADRCLVQIWNGDFEYHLHKWLPFNSDNYAEYKTIDCLSDKISFMEKILVGNILSFAKSLGIIFSSEISCKLLSIDRQCLYLYKGVKMMAFDITFKSNVTLPEFIGLGKGVSLGFGTVNRVKSEK